MKYILFKGVAALFSLTLALLLASVVLEVKRLRTSAAPVNEELARNRPAHADQRSKIEVIRDLRAEGIEAFPAVPGSWSFRYQPEGIPAGDRFFFPFTGISGVTTVQGIELDEYMIFVSDEYGFNNPPGLYRPDEVEVMVVGDSFARGEYVPPDSNAVACIRKTFPLTINLGCNAIGPWSMLGMIREYAKPMRPKFVVWCYYEGNDLMDIREERISYLTNYANPSYAQGLIARQDVIDTYFRQELNDRVAEEIQELGQQKQYNQPVSVTEGPLDWRRVVKLSRIRELLGLVRSGEVRELIKEYEQILSLARQQVEGWGGQLVFVYLPQWSSFQRLQRSQWMFENYREDILEIAGRLELPIIDVKERFLSEGDPLRFFPNRGPGHYTCDGYRVMGDAIEEKIRFTVNNRVGTGYP